MRYNAAFCSTRVLTETLPSKISEICALRTSKLVFVVLMTRDETWLGSQPNKNRAVSREEKTKRSLTWSLTS